MREGWREDRLGNLCKIQSGSSNTKDAVPNGAFQFFDRSKTPKRSDRFLFDCEAIIIAGEGAEFLPKKYLGKFDLHQRAYAIFGFGDLLIGNYLYYYLTYIHKYFQKVAVGATVKSLRQRHFEELPVLLPSSVDEQNRIVAILHEALGGIDAAIANTENNLANAQELFERYSDSIFTGNRQGWSETTLGEIADFKNGLNFTKSSKGGRVYIVGVKEFQSNYWVPTEKLNSVQIDGELSENYELRKNDILTVRSNGNKQLIGRCMLVRDVPEKTSHSGFTIRIRNHSQDIEPTYLAHYLKSSAVREMLVNSGGGANISSLNQKALSSLPLLFPSNEEQLKIVARTEAVKADTNLLVANYLNKLSLLSQFKQSLLAKAFSGELTAQPDYILKEAV